ncbi:plasmid transfer protein TraA [Streptomyces sp. NPDC058155]|uniref:plasmid transfer protein TraA n=1 Tax=Streptomyces sp. NPDC058155 TaxID=3346359 RepID=UPI0036EA2389
MTVPPQPRSAPTNGFSPAAGKVKNGGGFNPAASANLAYNKTTIINGGGGGQQGSAAGNGGKIPGSDFMSNEDIRAFCEYHRKKCRNGATELAMDADHLEAVLRAIPDLSGSLGGSRARSRRVSRWLKKAAAAEKAKQKYFAALYATFEAEFDSELRRIGKGKTQPRANRPFGWR